MEHEHWELFFYTLVSILMVSCTDYDVNIEAIWSIHTPIFPLYLSYTVRRFLVSLVHCYLGRLQLTSTTTTATSFLELVAVKYAVSVVCKSLLHQDSGDVFFPVQLEELCRADNII